MQTVLRRIRNVRFSRSTTLILVGSFLLKATALNAQSGTKCLSIVNSGGCQSCNLRYPDNSKLPRSAVDFNESEVLVAWEPSTASCNQAPTQIKLWYSDEHAMTLGVRQVNIKTKNGTATTNYPIEPTPTTATVSSRDPLVGTTIQSGDQTGNDGAVDGGRPLWPVAFVTDITTDPTSRSGDWQQGGTGFKPTYIYGLWKAAVRNVDMTKNTPTVTIDPDDDPKTANGTDLAGGDPIPAGIKTEKYTAEVVWDVTDLGLQIGHTYRIQFMVHDGDQNKTGGDVGQACATVVMPSIITPSPLPTAKATWMYNAANDTYTFRVIESKDFNNNTYGTSAINWPGGHTFKNLSDSDRVQMVLYDAKDKVVMDFNLDYLTNANGGYSTLGVNGGNGKLNKGNKNDIVSVRTSLSENFNTYGYMLTTNSPLTNNSYSPNATYPNWIYEVWYEVTVKGSVFKDGFGRLEIPFLYANPAKTGMNINNTVQTACPAQTSTIGGKVFHDKNNDGVFNTGDAILPGVKVNLYQDLNRDNKPDGGVIQTITTDKDGKYSFTGLADGAYIVGSAPTGGYEKGATVGTSNNPNNFVVDDNNGVIAITPGTEVRTNFIIVIGGFGPSDGGFGNNTIDIGHFKSQSPLGVSLVQFNGSTSGNNSVLTWRMVNESNVQDYIVERSTDGSNFVNAGSLNALRSGSAQNYSFNDANSANNSVMYYRLRIVSFDGSISYSNIIQLRFGSVKNTLLVYPNPANGYIVLNIGVEQRSNALIKLVNAIGQTVSNKTVLLNAGSNAITFDGLSQFGKGTYRVSVHLENGEEMGQTILLTH